MKAKRSDQRLALVVCDVFDSTQLRLREGELVSSTILRKFLAETRRLAKQYNSVLIKSTGDGFLAAFGDVPHALSFIASIQALPNSLPAFAGRGLAFRFGLHVGDVMLTEALYGREILGAAVDVTARLDALAQPGQIVITQAALDEISQSQATLLTQLGLLHPWETARIKWDREVEIRRLDLVAA